MRLFFTNLFNKLSFYLRGRQMLTPFFIAFCLLGIAQQVEAEMLDSSRDKKPVIISDLNQCRIPAFMVTRIMHLSPDEMKYLNEEYQHTDITESGQEMVTVVKLRFIDDHITGYIKEALINSSDKPQNMNYIDIPVEWMCIPPKQDHPFHFATSVKELDSIKEENGCLDWVQRDNNVIINFTQQKEKKKKKIFFWNNSKSK